MRRCAVLALLLSTPALAVALSVQLRPVGPIYTRQMLRPPVVMHAQQQSGLSNGHEHSNGVVREPEPKLSPLLNLPNMLTIARVAMVPFMQVLFYWESPWRNVACAGLFFLAAVTDFLDGFLARRWKIVSPFGTFLDPVADKLMVAAVLIQLSARVAAEGWVLEGGIISLSCGATLCREISVSALREWMAEQGARAAVKVGWLGKCKTALQMASLTLLLLVMPGGTPTNVLVNHIALTGLWVSTALGIVSGVQYFAAAWPYLSGSKSKGS